jgi:hypothetical protein
VESTSAIIIEIAANDSILTVEASEVAWRRQWCPRIPNQADRRAASLNRTESSAGASAQGEARTDVEACAGNPYAKLLSALRNCFADDSGRDRGPIGHLNSAPRVGA